MIFLLAYLEIVDSLLAIAFCSEISINVSKPMRPSFQLHQVWRLCSHCQVNRWLGIIDHQRESVLL